jgi:hypothetical protein
MYKQLIKKIKTKKTKTTKEKKQKVRKYKYKFLPKIFRNAEQRKGIIIKSII